MFICACGITCQAVGQRRVSHFVFYVADAVAPAPAAVPPPPPQGSAASPAAAAQEAALPPPAMPPPPVTPPAMNVEPQLKGEGDLNSY
jgi:hypothetical protein